jgi:hypothetical protein
MAKVATFASRLRNDLVQGLDKAGIKARVDTEPVKGTKLHRVFVIANAFAHLRPAERQDLVWRIVDQSLMPDERLQISMIYTVTESELPG